MFLIYNPFMTSPQRSENQPSPAEQRVFDEFKTTYKGLFPKLIPKPLSQILLGDLAIPLYQQTKDTVTKLIEQARATDPNINTIFLPLEIPENDVYAHLRLHLLADELGIRIGFVEQKKSSAYDTDALEDDPFEVIVPQKK